MKLSVSSYSFSQLTGSGRKTEFELIELAKDMGFEGIEFAEIHPPEGEDKAEYAKRLRDESLRVGIEIVNYTIGADFLNGSDGDLEKEIERLCGEVEIAKILGVKGMRHDAAWDYKAENRAQRGFLNALPRLAEGCSRVTEYAAKYGIRTMVENHGFFCQESARVEQLIAAVANENFGVLVDIGNFMCADEEPEKAVGRLAPFAFHVHAKDFHFKSGNSFPPQDGFFRTRAGNYLRGAIIGHGAVPVYQCLSVLKSNGYDGFVSVEFEGMEDCLKGIEYGKHTLEYLLGVIG